MFTGLCFHFCFQATTTAQICTSLKLLWHISRPFWLVTIAKTYSRPFCSVPAKRPRQTVQWPFYSIQVLWTGLTKAPSTLQNQLERRYKRPLVLQLIQECSWEWWFTAAVPRSPCSAHHMAGEDIEGHGSQRGWRGLLRNEASHHRAWTMTPRKQLVARWLCGSSRPVLFVHDEEVPDTTSKFNPRAVI